MGKSVYTSFLIVFYMLTSFAGANSKMFAQENEYAFIIVTNDTVSNLTPFSDRDFYKLSAKVIFQVAKAEIRRDDPFISLYNNEILPLINSERLQLRKVFIRGAASPDGSSSFNRRLGRARAQSLLAELQRNVQFQQQNAEVDTTNVAEDYGLLCILMEEANDPDYETVKAIYEKCHSNSAECKKALITALDGRLWPRLLRQYFPELRSARLILWFSRTDDLYRPFDLTYAPVELPIAEPSRNNISIPELSYSSRRHLIAVRTNLLHDAFYMPQFGWASSPNVQLEYYPLGGHYTYNVGMTWGTHRHWDTQEFFQVRDFEFELRRYFRGGGEFTGLYTGAYVQGDVYGIGLNKTKGWEGEGGGAGLSLGYVLPLNRKGNFRLEFMVAAGFFMTNHDPYVYGNPITGTIDGDYYYNYLGNATNFKKRNHRFTWIGPTNFGLQLTYDIIYRRNKTGKKGDAR